MRVKVSWTASSLASHGTQDVSVCNVIVSEADMSGLAYKLGFHFLNHSSVMRMHTV